MRRWPGVTLCGWSALQLWGGLHRHAQWQAVPGRIESAQAATAADAGIVNPQYDLRAQLRYSYAWQGRQRSG